MVTLLLVFGVVFLAWHFSDGIGKGGRFYVFLFLSFQCCAMGEMTEEQGTLLIEATKANTQATENLTAVVGYGVGLMAAFSLFYRIRLK